MSKALWFDVAVTTEVLLAYALLGCIAFTLVIKVGNRELSFKMLERFSFSLSS
jgi:hypothetical protein